MPKKTRRQKILSEKHRQSPQFSYKFTSASVPASVKPAHENDLSFIRTDILKTIILATFFIIAEILLTVFSRRWGW